jgi:hypothetical protein
MSRFTALTARLVNVNRAYDHSELEPEGGCDQRQRELSRQMTRLIDVLYALVMVQGALKYSSLFTAEIDPLSLERQGPVVVALLLIYFIAIQSFIDYHLASEVQPYKLLNKTRRKKDLARFYLDVVIVGLYSFFLLRCHVLLTDPAADLTAVFAGLVGMFVLYLIWGELRWSTKPEGAKPEPGAETVEARRPFRRRLLILFLVTYVALAVAYAELAEGWEANLIFLLIAALLMLMYRGMNWTQNWTCVEAPADKEPESPSCNCADAGASAQPPPPPA